MLLHSRYVATCQYKYSALDRELYNSCIDSVDFIGTCTQPVRLYVLAITKVSRDLDSPVCTVSVYSLVPR